MYRNQYNVKTVRVMAIRLNIVIANQSVSSAQVKVTELKTKCAGPADHDATTANLNTLHPAKGVLN